MSQLVQPKFDNMIMYSNLLADIASPLFKQLKIQNFGFVEIYSRGHWRMFNSKDDMFAESVESGFLENAPARIIDAYQTPGCYLTDIDQNLQDAEVPIATMLDRFGYGKSFRMVSIDKNKTDTVVRLFAYEGSANDPSINTTYINNIDLLTKFNQHVIDRMQTTCKQESMIPIQTDVMGKLLSYITLNTRTPAHLPAAQLHAHGHPRRSLSPQQRQVVIWYINGKTATETAELMGISRRTVERHFEILRKRFKCRSKFEIACKITEEGMIN